MLVGFCLIRFGKHKAVASQKQKLLLKKETLGTFGFYLEHQRRGDKTMNFIT